MTEEVKSCPFCSGKEVKLFKEGSIWVVECLQCLAKVGATAEADVLDFWNSRPIEDKLHEKIKKLEAENKRLREALEFYAELDGNGIQLYGDMDSKALEFVDGDSQIFGTIAKDALKGNEK